MSTSRERRRALQQLFAPGLGLAAAALALVVVVAAIDALRSDRHRSFASLLTPDPTAAGLTMGLLGTAEGVAIAIVIVVVVLGVQLTADRYSPRVIDIFIRDRLNGAVLALFLGSIIFTIGASAEIKPDYVPYATVYTAMGLAILDFTILLPYVRYLFQVMRGETIIVGIRRHAARAIARAIASPATQAQQRAAVRESLNQVADIALGSIQEGDTEVALAAIHTLRGLVCDDYVPVKDELPERWFTISHDDMPGASEQTIVQVDRTRTWLEHLVLATFVDLMGETPAFRKEIIHAIASTTRDFGRRAVHHGDRELEELVVRFFNTYFRAALNQRAPTFAYSVMNEYRRLAVDVSAGRPDLPIRVAEHLLRYGRAFDAAGMPFIIGTAAEDVSDLIVEMAKHDLDRALLLARQLSDTLTEMASMAQAVSLNGILKANVKLALWAIAEEQHQILSRIAQGLNAVQPKVLENALKRMEVTTERVFYEVSDRVVAYDWVEDHMRELIPILRTHLRPQEPARPLRPRRSGEPKPASPVTEASTATPRS
ncbi:MAG: DUF2254 domain-containing protein [Chloroflexi bacterium]|nr:MAG: DUF2254 domain-containing protein [Chloroflexota bacterium]